MNYGKLATCLASVSALGLLAACDGTGDQVKQEDASHSSMVMQSDADLGMTLPEGYVATIYADNLGFARHITTRDDGAVYVALRRAHEDKGIVALRDNDGDGHADDVQYFGDVIGTGIEVRGDYLYFGTDTAVVRFKFNGDELIPSGAMETVVSGFPEQRQHAVKPFTFDDDGNIYVNVGADANACQQEMRTAGSPGMMPCPILDVGAGIWKFNADATDQVFDGSARYATGIRNAVALDWNHSQNALSGRIIRQTKTVPNCLRKSSTAPHKAPTMAGLIPIGIINRAHGCRARNMAGTVKCWQRGILRPPLVSLAAIGHQMT